MKNNREAPQNKNRIIIKSSNSTSGYFSEENKNTNLKTYMFIAALLTIARMLRYRSNLITYP